MQTIKTMRKAIFQNKLTIYKANLPSFVQKIIKSRCYVDLRIDSHKFSRKMRESIEIEKHNTIDQEGKPLDRVRGVLSLLI